MTIDVVIPLFNKAAHVRGAIQSVLDQTRPANEVFVIDDGSTDDGARVVREFGDEVKLIQRPNGGVSSARNLGIEMASGETIAFLDADDVWKPQFLETVSKLLERYPSACVAGSAYDYLRPGQRLTQLRMASDKDNFEEGLIDYFACMANKGAPPFNSSAVIARRSALRQVGGFPVGQRWGEDHDTWVRLAISGDVAVTRKVLATVNVSAVDRATESPDPRPQLPAAYTVAKTLSNTSDPNLRTNLRKYLKSMSLNSPMTNLRHGHSAMARSQLLESRQWTGLSFRWMLLFACSYLPLSLVNVARTLRKPIAVRQGHF